ncbi:hypothetical protein GH714_025696 [Hevea brasiliensis]|uniref:Uncharacterized protein n=1 Tax=Hevea brasiliensis TaxID=3981 RepID=A0A6A6KUE3_HEVBR|nr:hypothetical protein GH714_025696 [Hevea brasiliensis]
MNAINVVLTLMLPLKVFASTDVGLMDLLLDPKLVTSRARITNLPTFGLVTRRLSALVTAPGHSTSQSTDHRATLVAPNNDVGVDGMVIKLGKPLWLDCHEPIWKWILPGSKGGAIGGSISLHWGYGKGAYPGYAGNLLVDSSTAASYNANGGENGRKYLLPAFFAGRGLRRGICICPMYDSVSFERNIGLHGFVSSGCQLSYVIMRSVVGLPVDLDLIGANGFLCVIGVKGFYSSKCGTYGSSLGAQNVSNGKTYKVLTSGSEILRVNAQLLLFVSLFHLNLAARLLTQSTETQQTLQFQYHNGPLLTGKISMNLIWYGKFKPSQRAIVSDFIASLSSPKPAIAQPSVATWWKATEKYYHLIKSQKASSLALSLGDVSVEGFCSSRCGTHGSSVAAEKINGKNSKFAYIWVGNSETQCPGQCAWPFHQPIYGPQTTPLISPNNDVGLDGMVINLASLLAGTATNPFGNGYFQGPKEAPLEAASACTGIYGKGAYPGYAGDLLVDSTTGASYNAHGVNGRKYLLPALFDPSTSTCSALV